ncbi:MAG: coiled-coil domain-containing protein [Bacillota bacterium]
MLRFHPVHRCLISAGIVLVFLALSGPASIAVELKDLARSDRERLGEHFSLMLAAERTREDREELDRNIEDVEAELAGLRERIESTQRRYTEIHSRTVEVLRWIHRKGSTSYWEVLLGASSLREVLLRAEVARTAARGAALTLEEIRREKGALDEMRFREGELESELGILRDRRDTLLVAVEELRLGEDALSRRFGSDWHGLKSELEELVPLWLDEADPYLGSLTQRFDRLARREVQPEGMSVEQSLFNFRVTVPEEGLSGLVQREPGLETTGFRFVPGEAQLIDEERRLVIRGGLDIDRQGVIRYEVSALEFAGLPMWDGSMIEMVDNIRLDLGSALRGLRPHDLIIEEGEMILILTFFQ